jgi:hypothetical protein
MNIDIGKSTFLWNTPLVCGGNPSAIADKLIEGGFDQVILKVADGAKKHVTNVGSFIKPKWVEAVSRETVRVLQARGLKVFGYGFCYGVDIPGEAHIAISQTIALLKLDGYVFDVEGRFEGQSDSPGRARTLGAIFRSGCPTTPAIFCGFAMFRSYGGGTWHNVELHKAMMAWCDAGMPMCYWPADPKKSAANHVANALALLNETMHQWRSITQKPIYPVGRAYNGDMGVASPEAMIAFDHEVHEIGLKGISWWVLDAALKLSPTIWAALKSMPGFAPAPPPSPAPAPLTLEERVTALEALHLPGGLHP